MIAEKGPSCNTEELFDNLVLEYQMPLKRLCFMYLRDMTLAEDAVQDTFLKVYKNMDQFREGCSMKTWIMKIGVNTCRDMLRSAWLRHRKMSVSPDDLQFAAEENEKDEEAEELGRALLKLPVRYKDVILLYYYQDMNLTEVAEALHTSTSTVSRRLKHAQDILRNELKGGWEDEQKEYQTESSSGSGPDDVLGEA